MFSNSRSNERAIEEMLSRSEAESDYTASNAGIKYYASEAVSLMRDLTDLSDEEIYDEIVNSTSETLSQTEERILAGLLGMS